MTELILLMTVLFQTPAAPMAGTIAPLLQMIERDFVGLADAMPAENNGFRPTAVQFTGVRSFAEQVKHVACANFAFYNEIEHKTPPEGCEAGGPNPAKTKAELMAYLRESFGLMVNLFYWPLTIVWYATHWSLIQRAFPWPGK